MTVRAAPVASWKNDRVFYGGMALAIAAVVFAGFSPTYFLARVFHGAPLNPLLQAHGLAFTAWILLFFSQTVLIATRRVDVHRKLGLVGLALAVAMVPLGIAAATWAIRANHTPPGIDPRSFLVLPFFDIALFAILVGVGIGLRKRPETHKRLMLLATVAMLDAPIARLPGLFALGPIAFFAIQDLFLIAGPAYDFATRRKVNPAYIWGGLLILAMQPIRLIVSQTPMWLAFGDWLKG